MSNLDENGSIKDPYENFIALSRYARWLDDKGRRETWAETVDRVVDFYEEDVYEKTGVKPNKKDLDAVREAVKSQNVMPSMRVAMTAGEALKRNNIAGFNCSFIAVDSLRAFDETLLILMQGTGLGFSVSQEQVSKLPKVADEVVPSRLNIIVEDSKEGWAAAFRTLISLLWDGYIPKFDTSKVRPAGARLKTFGGRASGPEPLLDLFHHTIDIVRGAKGRQLTPVEAHSIMCKIAEIVVVGGVRRCLPFDSIVQMDSGVKEIQQINVGDVVATGGGKYQVIGKVNSGVQQTLKIQHRFGVLECTPNHRVAYFTNFGEYGFKDASELELGDRLVWDLAGNFGEIQSLPKSTYNGHFNAKPFIIPDVVDTDVAWLIGLIHGDGHVAYRSIEISSNVDEWSTLERANAIFKDKFGIEGKIARDSHDGEGIRLRVNSKGLSLWFGEHIKVSNEQIRIPEFIWKSQSDVRAAYLAGVLDSDGRVKKDNSIEQTTTIYSSFSMDIASLCSTLGIGTATYFTEPMARRDRGENAKDFWTVMIRGRHSRRNYVATVGQFSEKLRGYESAYGSPIDFSYPADWDGPHRNRSTTHGLAKEYGLIDEDYQYAPSEITGIEFGRKVETYDIEVEGVHQFTTDGIVVHNSALISLSDLEDEEMAKAKIDEWWNKYPHFALANNSAIYYVKPTREQFDKEWRNLAESGSGERGIFNLEAARKKANESGRRDGETVFGTNPSLVPGTKVYTTDGIQNIEDLEGAEFYVRNLNGEISKAICWQSGVDKPVFNVNLRGGHSYGATEEHKWPVWTGVGWERKGTLELKPGDKLPNLVTKTMYPEGTKGTYDQGFLIGWNLGDGWQTDRPAGKQIGFIVSDDDRNFGNIDERLTKMLFELGSGSSLLDKDEINVNHPNLRSMFEEFGVKHKTEGLPDAVWRADVSDEFRRGLIDALISTDGSVEVKQGRILFLQSSKKMVDDFCSLLGFFGIKTSIGKRVTTGSKAFKDKEIYKINDRVFEGYVVRIGSHENVKNFSSIFDISRTDKQDKIIEIVSRNNSHKPKDWFVEVSSVEEAGTSDVWDVSVFDETHAFQIDHCVTGNCGEIFLRNGEFCNLSEVIVRDTDTLADLKRKVELATKIGTWQSTLTDIKYIRDHWKQNTEEERLLGVSLTGQLGHPVLSKPGGDKEKIKWLKELKKTAINTNAKEADRLGIPRSVAITTCKPSGTVSQLTSSASGMHAWHNDYYIRTVRGDNKDPITQFMKDAGIPHEPCVMKPDSTTVFSFPRKAPEGALTRKDLTAIEHLEIWLDFQRYWCEHNPSVTISVKEEEWEEVGNWVWDHFDEVTGVSFLPFSDHTYQQAPYQDVSKAEYEALLEEIPTSIDWADLSFYEVDDSAVKGTQSLSCVGDKGCESADLV